MLETLTGECLFFWISFPMRCTGDSQRPSSNTKAMCVKIYSRLRAAAHSEWRYLNEANCGTMMSHWIHRNVTATLNHCYFMHAPSTRCPRKSLTVKFTMQHTLWMDAQLRYYLNGWNDSLDAFAYRTKQCVPLRARFIVTLRTAFR